MKVWKIVISRADDYCASRMHTIYFGVAQTAEVAVRQTLRLAKKEFRQVCIESVECLGDLDFCTKR